VPSAISAPKRSRRPRGETNRMLVSTEHGQVQVSFHAMPSRIDGDRPPVTHVPEQKCHLSGRNVATTQQSHESKSFEGLTDTAEFARPRKLDGVAGDRGAGSLASAGGSTKAESKRSSRLTAISRANGLRAASNLGTSRSNAASAGSSVAERSPCTRSMPSTSTRRSRPP